MLLTDTHRQTFPSNTIGCNTSIANAENPTKAPNGGCPWPWLEESAFEAHLPIISVILIASAPPVPSSTPGSTNLYSVIN